MNIEEILLWLFIVNLGIVFGAGLYELRIVLPLWFSSPPQSIGSPDSGVKFWAFVSTGPLTALSIANLVIALQVSEPRHDWWLVSAIIILVERLLTFAYFIPTIIRLQRSTAPAGEVMAGAVQWKRMNYLRNALTLVSWLAALKTLSLPG